ncbi:MAG TPA: DNA mismatch repair endonuclease MutL [Thermoanaerobaculia bacterium]|nr:DNA mismatch repair endonuclease MutL [Thermoanaerobaculia bacterium]
MAAILVLPEALVDQIAAGEVVERPASAVKELVENALDAGARRISVDVEGGGVARLEVVDDGSGMSPEDARLALERHATSKLRTFEDLTSIGTMGFRGEALPSIASVSRLALTTSPDASGLGTEVVAERGAPPRVSPARHPKGTRVVVEDLFGNVPARRKFLKSAEAELRAVVKAVTALALSRPDVAFTLRAGPRLLLDLPASSGVAARFREVLGIVVAAPPLDVDFAFGGMRMAGAVTPPEATFPSRAHQWFFVNGRSIRDATVAHAVAVATREVLRSNRHAGFALFLTCAPELCDVNVHPQKLEVRFRDPNAVHTLVHRGLVHALTGGKGAVAVEGEAFEGERGRDRERERERREDFLERGIGRRGAAEVGERAARYGAGHGAASGPSHFGAGGGAGAGTLLNARAVGPSPSSYSEEIPSSLSLSSSSQKIFSSSSLSSSPVGDLRLLGQYRDSFLVAEGEEGLVLVDQHVAHERVRYERFLARLEAVAPASQRLLSPAVFEASPLEAALLSDSDALLSEAGFSVSELSGRTFLVSAAPSETPASSVLPALRDYLARLAALPEGSSPSPALRREVLAASLACRGAITVNHRLAPAEAARLLSDLAACRDPWTCPHGRPILLAFSHEDLEQRFGRRG